MAASRRSRELSFGGFDSPDGAVRRCPRFHLRSLVPGTSPGTGGQHARSEPITRAWTQQSRLHSPCCRNTQARVRRQTEFHGNPNFVRVPMDELLDAGYAARRRALVTPRKAYPGMRPASLGSNWDNKKPQPYLSGMRGQTDTSYVCTVDADGNAFSATPSDACESSPVVPGLGFTPSARGAQSWIDQRAPAALGPGRRPRLTPSPAFALKPGRWLMPIGSPGHDVQPQAILQVLLNMVAWEMTPQQAIDQPRSATFSFPRSSDHTHTTQP